MLHDAADDAVGGVGNGVNVELRTAVSRKPVDEVSGYFVGNGTTRLVNILFQGSRSL